MVYRKDVPGTSEDWADVDDEIPGYTAEASTAAEPSSSQPALNITPKDIVIAVMGITGSGKSTFISHFAEGVVIGHTLEACTSAVGIYESRYDAKTKIFFVDTPGFDDTYKSDTDILREIADWLSQAYGNDIKLTGIVYLHRILDVRLGGSAMKNLRMFKKLCGDDALPSVVLATTWWSNVDAATGSQRETELATREAFWAGMISKGSRMFRQDNGAQSARHIVDYLVSRKRPVTLKIQEELVDEKKTLDETGAGLEVDAQLAAQKKEFEAKLLQIQTDMQKAMKEKDREYHEELLAFKRETEAKMKAADEDRLKLQLDRETLRREMDAELAEERIRVMKEIQGYNERMIQNEHALRMMEASNANALAVQRLQFEVDKERAEKERLAETMRQKKKGCVVM